ncbi:MAG: Holliday junction branch migration protein RuvA [Armatimonadetes bacterium]|nr:Holliday junction branch migration protein RuvA [Armatimonadota bacterium]MDE2207339.1 Holliday junction branch migration protein RuvA [Armatimonadota bacterium]
MIAQITGRVVNADGALLVVEVQGIGYAVQVPSGAAASPPAEGDTVTLFTHLALSPNTMDIALYGFNSSADLRAFKLLISTSGVGPRVALGILGALSVDELADALHTNDIRTITAAPGVGPKLAQRMCLELGDKMAEQAIETRLSAGGPLRGASASNAMREDVVEALVSLGYNRIDARRAADLALSSTEEGTGAGPLVAAALATLSAAH